MTEAAQAATIVIALMAVGQLVVAIRQHRLDKRSGS